MKKCDHFDPVSLRVLQKFLLVLTEAAAPPPPPGGTSTDKAASEVDQGFMGGGDRLWLLKNMDSWVCLW